MNRRKFLVGAAGAGVLLAGVGAWLRPSAQGPCTMITSPGSNANCASTGPCAR